MTGVMRFGLVAAALLAAAPAGVDAAGEAQLDGVYVSDGVNPDGSAYQGVVRVVRQGDSFAVTWLVAQATGQDLFLVPAAVGVGIVDGGVLAVSYYAPRMSGVVLYRIEEGGRRLIGRWTIAGADGAAYAETLTRLPEDADPTSVEPPSESKPLPPVRSSHPSVGRAL